MLCGDEDALGESGGSVRELRSLLVDIYPPNLEMSGLAAAIHDTIDGLGPDVVVSSDVADLPDLDPQTRAVIYRIAREALVNVEKHSHARGVSVALTQNDGEIRLRVADDGEGFDPTIVKDGHMGLRIISDLAHTSGGQLDIRSALGAGTEIDFTLERP